MGHQLVQNIAGQHIAAEGGLVDHAADRRLGAGHRVFQLGGKVPAVLALNAVLHRQVAALPRFQIVVGVGVAGKEHPVPGLGVGLGGIGQMGYIGLRSGVCQRTGDKVLLHIDHNVKNDFFALHVSLSF